MSAHRFFLAGPLVVAGAASPGDEVALELGAADLHHAVDVLRVRRGEEIDAVEPSGRAWRLRVTQAARDALRVEVVRELATSVLAPVTLVIGVAKGDKMDTIVRQATELGAGRIVPVLTERCVVRLTPARAAEKTERWKRVAHAAAKQARRGTVPQIATAVPLETVLGELGEQDCAVVAWEECAGESLADAVRARTAGVPDARVAVVVGPEGGLSESEVAVLAETGAVTVSLGPTILRTETAAVAALAVVMSVLDEAGPARG